MKILQWKSKITQTGILKNWDNCDKFIISSMNETDTTHNEIDPELITQSFPSQFRRRSDERGLELVLNLKKNLTFH